MLQELDIEARTEHAREYGRNLRAILAAGPKDPANIVERLNRAADDILFGAALSKQPPLDSQEMRDLGKAFELLEKHGILEERAQALRKARKELAPELA